MHENIFLSNLYASFKRTKFGFDLSPFPTGFLVLVFLATSIPFCRCVLGTNLPVVLFGCGKTKTKKSCPRPTTKVRELRSLVSMCPAEVDLFSVMGSRLHNHSVHANRRLQFVNDRNPVSLINSFNRAEFCTIRSIN